MGRSRRELSNEYLLAKFGFDTAENEPSKVCRIPGRAQDPGTNTSAPYSEPRDLLQEVVELEQVRPELIEAVALFLTDFTGLVLGCIEAKFCKKICV